jgi:hypothetical protein
MNHRIVMWSVFSGVCDIWQESKNKKDRVRTSSPERGNDKRHSKKECDLIEKDRRERRKRGNRGVLKEGEEKRCAKGYSELERWRGNKE